jgi:serine/threonine protein phosphatase PrpC
MVVCPHCEHDSADPLFCDRCNGLLPASVSPLPLQVHHLDGEPIDCSGWHGSWPVDCWRPLVLSRAGRPCRVYAVSPTWWPELETSVREREALSFDVLAPLEIVPVEAGAVVVAAGLCGAEQPLLTGFEGEELDRVRDAVVAAYLLAAALEPLHQSGLVWLNFDPAALEVAGATVQITNLDLQLFRSATCPDSLRLSTAFSPPEVCGFRGERIGPATDVFHVSLYLYYRLAGLLPGGFPGQGLEAFDFAIPPLRIYRPRLPVGIAPVLERGLARDPSDRFPTVTDLVAELTSAFDRARSRHSSRIPISWSWSSMSLIGRTHEVQGLPNQDSHVVVTLPREGDASASDQLLAVVADGVTHARIGSGEVASQATVEILESSLTARLRQPRTAQQREAALSSACIDASRAILDIVRTILPADEYEPSDVMSSTVVAGLLSGNELTLASAGDSRAYLISDGRAEQLTVDGDVACMELASGAPPEFVRDMGPESGALYSCIGVGEKTADGLEVSLVRSLPAVTRWPLVPGDVLVLCSDGLVEEGVFLDSVELAMLVGEFAGRPPAELVDRLVQAARGKHRDPSPWEPTGCGDDITCIVVVIGPATDAGRPG